MLDQNTVSGFQNEAVVRLGCAAMSIHLTSPNFIHKSRQDGKCYNFNIVLKFKKKSLLSKTEIPFPETHSDNMKISKHWGGCAPTSSSPLY